MRRQKQMIMSGRMGMALLLLAGTLLVVFAFSQGKGSGEPAWTDATANEKVKNTLEQFSEGDKESGRDDQDQAGSVKTTEKQPEEASGVDAGQQPEQAAASGSSASAASSASEPSASTDSAAIQSPAAAATPSASPSADTSDNRININQATAEELDTLPGIGEAKARAIVDDRTKNGRYQSADDLLRVKGIGSKMLEKIKPFIVALP